MLTRVPFQFEAGVLLESRADVDTRIVGVIGAGAMGDVVATR
ncbi:MAG: hypothetical protein WKF43_13395 [Acidimicrobiales bacterium]